MSVSFCHGVELGRCEPCFSQVNLGDVALDDDFLAFDLQIDPAGIGVLLGIDCVGRFYAVAGVDVDGHQGRGAVEQQSYDCVGRCGRGECDGAARPRGQTCGESER